MALQVTQISMKPVLHHEQFTLYNEFVNNVISLGSYHLEGEVMRIFFGEPDSQLELHAASHLQAPFSHHATFTASAAYARPRITEKHMTPGSCPHSSTAVAKVCGCRDWVTQQVMYLLCLQVTATSSPAMRTLTCAPSSIYSGQL